MKTKQLSILLVALMSIMVVGAIVVLNSRLHQPPQQKSENLNMEPISIDAVIREIMTNPGDLRLDVLPGTVKITSAELIDSTQLTENDCQTTAIAKVKAAIKIRISINGQVIPLPDKFWVVSYECSGGEYAPGHPIYIGPMRVWRVLDAYNGGYLSRSVENLEVNNYNWSPYVENFTISSLPA